jgi:hypothetical protein
MSAASSNGGKPTRSLRLASAVKIDARAGDRRRYAARDWFRSARAMTLKSTEE